MLELAFRGSQRYWIWVFTLVVLIGCALAMFILQYTECLTVMGGNGHGCRSLRPRRADPDRALQDRRLSEAGDGIVETCELSVNLQDKRTV